MALRRNKNKGNRKRIKVDTESLKANGEKNLMKARNEGNYILRCFSECNYRILMVVAVLAIFGLVMVFSAGYYQTVNMEHPDAFFYLKRQGFNILTGLVLLTFATCFDYHNYTKISKIIILISIAALLFVLVAGASANGAQRWIAIGPLRITPSEFSKLFVIIYTSVYLAADPGRIKGKGVYWLFMIMLVHAALIIKQPNLSTAIVICAIMVGIMFIAGLSYVWIVGMFGLAGAGTLFILKFMQNTHWYSRLTSFRDPFADAQGSGYQVCQSLIALGNGGLKGLGLGNSVTKNLYLPEPQNDFILAVIGEELGFIGFLLMMAVYIVLLFMLIMTAAKAKDRLGFYLASGVAIMLGLQVAINVAVVTSSMPATGITLPFISYGGTSMWVFMYSIGIVLNVSRGQNKRKAAQKK